ncbi:DNA ligase 3 [Platysternon megacephalum]|uniref:DNA ligase 3 n=1 Tax=Platysternon megacephalum TaxID=55544 RepID=A0A4D9EV72_9SAUR|nr:DNA ligase 3 [Platysternon megacephalum]
MFQCEIFRREGFKEKIYFGRTEMQFFCFSDAQRDSCCHLGKGQEPECQRGREPGHSASPAALGAREPRCLASLPPLTALGLERQRAQTLSLQSPPQKLLAVSLAGKLN